MKGLKGSGKWDDSYFVTSCASCSLPVSGARETCAYCSGSVLAAPMLARLTRKSPCFFELTAGAGTLGRCWTGGDSVWHAQVGSGAPMDLVKVADSGDVDVLLFDTSLNVVASMHVLASGSVVLTDAGDTVTTVIRSDGRGGIRGIAPTGEALIFAGRGTGDAIDLLVTEAGCARPLIMTFALIAALEAHCLGPLFASS